MPAAAQRAPIALVSGEKDLKKYGLPDAKDHRQKVVESNSRLRILLTIDVDMDRAHEQREALKQEGVKVSFNDLVIKASAMA